MVAMQCMEKERPLDRQPEHLSPRLPILHDLISHSFQEHEEGEAAASDFEVGHAEVLNAE